MIQKARITMNNPLFIIWIAAFTDIFIFTIINPFLPRFYLDLGAPLAEIGFLLAINSFISFFSGLFWGKLSDRFGRKPVLLICRLGAFAGYLILAFSSSIWMVILSRVVDGIFSRSILITLTAVGDLVEPENRSAEMSKVGIPWIAGGLAGPAIGGLLSSRGLLGIGLGCAALALATFLLTLFTFKETHPLAGEANQNRVRFGEKPTFANSLSLLKKHNPRVLLSLNLFAFITHLILVTTSSLYLSKQFNLNVEQIGTLLSLIGGVNLAIRMVIYPKVLGRLGDRRTYRIGLLVFMAAYANLFFVNHIWQFAISAVLVSFGTTCTVDVMHGIMSRSVKRDEQGEMMGLNSAVESISSMTGPIIGSSLLSLKFSGFYPLSAVATSLIGFLISLIPLKEVAGDQLKKFAPAETLPEETLTD